MSSPMELFGRTAAQVIGLAAQVVTLDDSDGNGADGGNGTKPGWGGAPPGSGPRRTSLLVYLA